MLFLRGRLLANEANHPQLNAAEHQKTTARESGVNVIVGNPRLLNNLMLAVFHHYPPRGEGHYLGGNQI